MPTTQEIAFQFAMPRARQQTLPETLHSESTRVLLRRPDSTLNIIQGVPFTPTDVPAYREIFGLTTCKRRIRKTEKRLDAIPHGFYAPEHRISERSPGGSSMERNKEFIRASKLGIEIKQPPRIARKSMYGYAMCPEIQLLDSLLMDNRYFEVPMPRLEKPSLFIDTTWSAHTSPFACSRSAPFTKPSRQACSIRHRDQIFYLSTGQHIVSLRHQGTYRRALYRCPRKYRLHKYCRGGV